MYSVVFEVKSHVQYILITFLSGQEKRAEVRIPESQLNSVIYSLSGLGQVISFFWLSISLFFLNESGSAHFGELL